MGAGTGAGLFGAAPVEEEDAWVVVLPDTVDLADGLGRTCLKAVGFSASGPANSFVSFLQLCLKGYCSSVQ